MPFFKTKIMGLEIKICAIIDPLCKTIEVTDKTGFYAANNLGGYGTPNPEVGEITNVIIKITDVLNTESEFTDIAWKANEKYLINIDEIPNFGTGLIGIESEFIGIDSNLGDVNMYAYCEQKSIVNDLYRQLTTPGCCDSCSKERQCEVAFAENTLSALEHAATIGDESKFDQLVKLINTYKNFNLCNCK